MAQWFRHLLAKSLKAYIYIYAKETQGFCTYYCLCLANILDLFPHIIQDPAQLSPPETFS